jgi:hypothetical protein
MRMSTIPIAPAVYSLLSLDVWNGLSNAERQAVARHVSDRLTAHGWQLTTDRALRHFGPAGDTQMVAQWFEGRTGLTFSLVPGGTFQPGYSRELLTEYDAVYRLLQAADFLEEEELDEDEEEFSLGADIAIEQEVLDDLLDSEDSPYLDTVYHCGWRWRCDLRARPAVSIGPFLMATSPVLGGTTPVVELLSGAEVRCSGPFAPVRVKWPDLGRVLQGFGWSLPRSVEFEWSVRGGREGLFFWGNTIPAWLARKQGARSVPGDRLTTAVTFDDLMRDRFEPQRPRRWPWCNRFGLADLLGSKTWCAPSDVPGDEFPLIYRGGAHDCYPWQYCREWRLFLTAIESRMTQHHERRQALRPIVRLRSEDEAPEHGAAP